MNQQIKTSLGTAVLIIFAVTCGVFVWLISNSWPKDKQEIQLVKIDRRTRDTGPVACTMEAKLCSDGKTYVSRTGPNCEFTECPSEDIATWKTYRNEKYGFEVQYPKNMPIGFNEDNKLLYIGEVAYEPAAGSMSISIEDKNIAQYRDFIKENWEGVACSGERSVVMGGVKFQSVLCPERFAGGEIEMYFIEYNQRIYSAEFIKSDDDRNNEVFRKIISTFKFIK